MLALQILAPENILIVEFSGVLFENFDCLSVRQPDKLVLQDVFEPLFESVIHKFVEEFQLVRAAFANVRDDGFHHRFRDVHIPVQIAESHFRLDHPEFRRMTGSVGFFTAESGAEGIDVRKRHGERLAVQLSGTGDGRFLAEKVLFVIDALAVPGFGQPVQIERGHLEHTARALAVAARDDGGMHIDKPAVVEKFMNGKRRFAADPEHRGKEIGAGAEMRNDAQKFHRVPLFLQGIIGRGFSLYVDFFRFDLVRLLIFRRGDHFSRHDERSAHVLPRDFVVVGKHGPFKHDLRVFEATAVVEFDKSERLGIADSSCPACHRHALPVKLGKAGGNFFQKNPLHSSFLSPVSGKAEFFYA